MFTTPILISILLFISLAVFCFVVLRGVAAPRSGLFGPVVHRGVGVGGGKVALTFDDGPDAQVTPRILDILRDTGVSAAFFIIGGNCEGNESLLRRIHDEGHVLGNHSFSHSHYGSLRWSEYWDDEFARTDAIINSEVGVSPVLFRPPMGLRNPRMMHSARRRGYTTITWSCRGLDGVTTTAERILKRLRRDINDGSIIVLHDGTDPHGRRNSRATIDALPRLIEEVRQRGLEFVRLDRLIEVEPYLEADSAAD